MNLTTETESSVSASASLNDAVVDLATAFQTVLNSLSTANPANANAQTVTAFQTVLDAMVSFQRGSAAEDAASPSATPSPPVSPVVAPALAPVVAPAPAPVLAPAPAPALAALVPVIPGGLRTSGPWNVGFLYIVVPPQHLAAIPDPTPQNAESLPVWYAISKGRFVGVTLSNALALAATTGVSGASMKSHKTQVLALAAFNEALDFNSITIVP
ncbi:hypothetical protein R3P38DRAFT_3224665 [Favolaschia claudopus]|uniref:Uncharacterized protein n=1 Tax=Favolaschia claudopus TaxID=2862362 RepID=A0AAV9ZVN2_9AGAR